MRRILTGSILFAAVVLLASSLARAAETDELVEVLKKVDQSVCKKPKEIAKYYGKNLVIMSYFPHTRSSKGAGEW